MPIINRKTNLIKNSPSNDYWKEVDQKSQVLITEILQEKLPANLSKSLDCQQDEDYRALLPAYQEQYGDNLPESDLVASEIAYEYLLIVAKSLIKSLKNFVCHSPEYMEDII